MLAPMLAPICLHSRPMCLIATCRLSLAFLLSVLQALTLEQVVSKRRKMVKEMCSQMAAELQLEVQKRHMGSDWGQLLALWPAAGEAATALLDAWHSRYSDREPAFYNTDTQFKAAVEEAVDAVHICKAWPDALLQLQELVGVDGQGGSLFELLKQTELSLESRCWDWGAALPACVTAILSKDSALASLNLGHNQLLPSALRGIAFALEHNCTLTTLKLQYNAITPEAAGVFARALSANKGLHTLDLCSCSLEREGARLICHGLRANRSVTRLNLMSNDLGDEALTSICKLLRVNNTLRHIDLRSNGFGAKFNANALVAALRMNAAISGSFHSLDLRPGSLTPNRLPDNLGEAKTILLKFVDEAKKNRTTQEMIDLKL